MKRAGKQPAESSPVYERIREILESAKVSVARSVNTTQVVANWPIGREIVEEEQRGKKRAEYGEELLADLSQRLARDFGNGYSVPNLRNMRQFYGLYPSLIDPSEIRYAVRSESAVGRSQISKAVPAESADLVFHQEPDPRTLESRLLLPPLTGIGHAVRSESWQPGQLHPNLSWTHYRTLMRVESAEARAFYEIETIQSNWSTRELERQINSLLYERLAMSKEVFRAD